MNFKSLAILLLILLTNVPAEAQSSSRAAVPEGLSGLLPEEKQALEKKALALLDELVIDGRALRLAENRIRVLIFAADMLRKRDDARAREYLREASNEFRALGPLAAAKGSRPFPSAESRQSLRRQLIITIAQFDAQMALDFLKASRLSSTAEPGLEDERQIEVQLAAEVIESDPRLALQLATEALKQEPDYHLVEIWRRLQKRDPKAAANLANDIATRLKSSDLMKSYGAASVVNELIDEFRKMVRDRTPSGRESLRSSEPAVSIQEVEQTFRTLLDLVVTAALKITAANLMDVTDQSAARNVLSQAQSFLPDVEKYLPARASALRIKLNQFDHAYYHSPPMGDSYQDLEKRSTDELLVMAEKSKGEMREMLYSQVTMKALEEDRIDLAKQISSQRLNGSDDFMNDEIERAEQEKALREGKIEEVRRALDEVPSEAERARKLVSMAGTVKDPKIQRRFLDDARGLLGEKVETLAQVEAQVTLAASFLSFDADDSFARLDAAIEKLNHIISASITVKKFTREIEAEEEELRTTQSDATEWFTGGIENYVLTFARKDFVRTQAAIAQWQHNPTRLAIKMTLIAAILGGEDQDLRRRYLFAERAHGLTK